jgi:hypothetical protein
MTGRRTMAAAHLRSQVEHGLRRGLERVRGSSPALVPEYPLALRSRWGWNAAPTLPGLAELLVEGSADYMPAVELALELGDWAQTIPRTAPGAGDPCWENDWWGTIDALVQCGFLRERDPALYVEIGSGFSTLFARRAISDFALRTRIVSVDPVPRAEVDGACDEVLRRPFQDVSEEILGRVQAGDVMLVDGSHVALMNTDATVFLLELLPRLPVGILVGIDDVFLPWDYPPQWTGRIYGEQYLLAAFLLGGGGGWRVRFPGWWVVEESSLAKRLDPLWPRVENRFGRHATSFWLERER